MQEFCAACGQRHVPREAYDLRGLVFDYTVQVVSKLKLLGTLWTLFRHPGRLTRDFMAGHRKPQVNPLWLFVFFWSTTTTAILFVSDHSGSVTDAFRASVAMPGNTHVDMDVLFDRIVAKEWITWTLGSYARPVIELLTTSVIARILWTRSGLAASVYGLHIATVSMITGAPFEILRTAVRDSLWGQFAANLLTLVFTAVLVLFAVASARVAFDLRGKRPLVAGGLGLLVGYVVQAGLVVVVTMMVWLPIVLYLMVTAT